MDHAKRRRNMGKSYKTLDFTKPIETRGGCEVRLYDIFDGRYFNGAYYDSSDDIWYPLQWGRDGMYGATRSDLDLVNVNGTSKKDQDSEL